VIIGIIDTGIDVSHADFRNASNQSRVKYLWDQTAFGSGAGTGTNYGIEYTDSQINAGQVPETDTNGHGTLIAGIAASNGRATSGSLPAYRYVGIAPEADLVVVKSLLQDTQIIDGASYVIRKAASLNKDCVILIAAGNNYGAHDGTSSLDVALSGSRAGPHHHRGGGNQGGTPVHSRVNLAAGATSTTTFTIPTYTPNVNVVEYLDIEGWHAPTATFAARVTSPSGQTTGWINPGGSTTISSVDGTFYLGNDVLTNSKGAKQIRAYLWDAGDGYAPKVGTWKLELQRQTAATTGVLRRVDRGLALRFGQCRAGVHVERRLHAARHEPATGDSIISVGAFTTKNQWTYVGGGSSFYPENPPLNGIAAFSSPGPRRDGVQRPDIVARDRVWRLRCPRRRPTGS
jgi:hypothetical protein